MKVLNKFRFPVGTRRRSGELCPESGVWKSLGEKRFSAIMRKGQVFPSRMSGPLTWMLITYE